MLSVFFFLSAHGQDFKGVGDERPFHAQKNTVMSKQLFCILAVALDRIGDAKKTFVSKSH